MIFSDFRPAEYHAGKSSYVAFYVLNPDTGNLVRKRIKVNRVARGQNRDKYARTLCCEINRKLYEGWNPYLENDAYFSGTSIQKGIREFLDTKGKNVRPDTFRSYHSYLKWFNNFLQRSGKTQMPIKTFTDRDAEKAMKELGTRTDIGAATYNSYLEFFRNLFNFFIARNWLKYNPFNRIERKREEQKRRDLIPPHIRQQIADYFVRTQQIPYLYFDATTLTTTSYDILDRPLKVVLPTLDSTKTAYGFGTEGGKTYFSTTATDPNGIAVTTLTGTRKQQVKTVAPLGAVTTFTYDPLGQLLSSKDPCGHITTYTYDMLGRMVQRVHPDAGTDTYTYDGAGNVTTHATQVLANANKSIHYYYTYNRLDSIVYPNNPQNNVRYTYGDSTAGNNQRGRIALMEDASGFQTFIYGKLGEVIENNRTFVLPNETYPYSFNMKYTYDSWNRIQNITYPDGEVVHYKYNKGGMLDTVFGRKKVSNMLNPLGGSPSKPSGPQPDWTTYTYHYINHTTYNEFELKSEQWFGNGTHSQYTYDTLQRLKTLQLWNVDETLLQDVTYTYDKGGNITRIQNTAGTTSSLGGQYSCRYVYDSLYRLISAKDTSLRNGVVYGRYMQTMSYDAVGRILSKSGQSWVEGTSLISVSNAYSYNTGRPHILSTVTNRGTQTSYRWDANGNMTEANSGFTRPPIVYYSLEWDEENRLRHAEMPQSYQCAYYQYDASGERFYKNVGEINTLIQNGVMRTSREYLNPTLYASPYMVVSSNSYTKHYFVDNERFASRIGDGDFSDIGTHTVPDSILAAKQTITNNAAPQRVAPNHFSFLNSLTANWSSHHTTYWQHPDHLGSASWVTDTNGRGYQHLQYRAWGEPFIDQRTTTNGYETRYTFSGKERDEETGYSYFGSRYYNSSLSIWLSVDPMSEFYPNQSNYVYCSNNPLRLVDPNGMFETRTEARRYRREHHTGGIIRKNPNNDGFSGNYLIVNKKAGVFYTKPQYESSDGVSTYGQDNGVVNGPIIHFAPSLTGGKVMAGTMMICSGLAVDDASIFGIADDALIPVILVGGSIIAGSIYLFKEHQKNKSPSK